MIGIVKHFCAYAARCFFALALLAGCGKTKPCSPQTYFAQEIGNTPFKAQLALTPTERMNGLMGRERLDDGLAMLFVFDAPQKMSFWMKNVPIDLDIGFFDPNLKLLQIRRMYAYDLSAVESDSGNVKFCLEVPAGWFARNGIGTGQTLNAKLLEKALAKRGKKPEKYSHK